MNGLAARYASQVLAQFNYYADPNPGSGNYELFTCFNRRGDQIVTPEALSLTADPIRLVIGNNHREQPVSLLLQSVSNVESKVTAKGSGSGGGGSGTAKLTFTFHAQDAFILLMASSTVRSLLNVESYAQTLHDRLKAHPDVVWKHEPLHTPYAILTEAVQVKQFAAFIANRAGATASIDVTATGGLIHGGSVTANAQFQSFTNAQMDGVECVVTPHGATCTPLFKMVQFNQRLLEQPKFVPLP